MTLWLIMTVMTSAAAVWLSVPLARRFDRPPTDAAGNIAVYRDQLREIESELQQGAIDDGQAKTAGVEIKRRILAAAGSEPGAMPSLSSDERKFAIICVTGFVVLGSTGLYAITGNPDLPSMPGSRAAQLRATSFSSTPSAQAYSSVASQAPEAEDDGVPRSPTGLPTVEDMIGRLAARLSRNPKDTDGWRTLGWSYLSIGRFDEAADAYARAIALNPDVAEFRGGHIEALVASANGVVTSEARAAIEDALRLDPTNVRARFFGGLAKEQAGDKAAALADWTALRNDASPSEPWLADLDTRISDLEGGLRAARGDLPAAAKPVIAGVMPAISKSQRISPAPEAGPRQQDVQAAQAMSPADRSAMVRGMVDGLAIRLERSPRDAEGWIKLIRSHIVLGESELARQALEHSLTVFADSPPERERIAAAARQLGVSR